MNYVINSAKQFIPPKQWRNINTLLRKLNKKLKTTVDLSVANLKTVNALKTTLNIEV